MLVVVTIIKIYHCHKYHYYDWIVVISSLVFLLLLLLLLLLLVVVVVVVVAAAAVVVVVVVVILIKITIVTPAVVAHKHLGEIGGDVSRMCVAPKIRAGAS